MTIRFWISDIRFRIYLIAAIACLAKSEIPIPKSEIKYTPNYSVAQADIPG